MRHHGHGTVDGRLICCAGEVEARRDRRRRILPTTHRIDRCGHRPELGRRTREGGNADQESVAAVTAAVVVDAVAVSDKSGAVREGGEE